MEFLRRVLGEPGPKETYEGGTIGTIERFPAPAYIAPRPRLSQLPLPAMPAVPVEQVETTGLAPLAPEPPLESIKAPYLPPLRPTIPDHVPVPYLPPLTRKPSEKEILQRQAPEVYGYPGEPLRPSLTMPGGITLPPGMKPPDAFSLVDWGFVKGLEDNRMQGYIPKDPDKGRLAGVTIGAGVDLGQMNANDLTKLGLREPLMAKLTPYTGITGKAAADLLKKKPLTLTEAEAAEVTDARKRAGIDRLSTKLAEAGVDFVKLPSEVATAVASVGWHLGENLPANAPKLTAKLKKAQETQDFKPVVLELRNFGTHPKFKPRRNQEADLIESWIKKNQT